MGDSRFITQKRYIMTGPILQEILASSVVLANESATLVRGIFKNGDLGVIDKGGLKNYQTEADRAVQRLIISTLSAKFPGVNIIGEEDGDDGSDGAKKDKVIEEQDAEVLSKTLPAELQGVKPEQITIWIDPLDGTMEFIDRLLHHVTILIGVAVDDKAIAGVINQPFFGFDDESKKPEEWGRSIWGVVGLGSFGPFEQKKLAADEKIICTTRSHSSKAVNACIEAMQPDNVLRQGGAGNKVLRVIEGDAHAYVFASPGTKKWDTCAPEAILVAMGEVLTDMQGNELKYGKDVKFPNSAGVLATISSKAQKWYVEHVPQSVRDNPQLQP